MARPREGIKKTSHFGISTCCHHGLENPILGIACANTQPACQAGAGEQGRPLPRPLQGPRCQRLHNKPSFSGIVNSTGHEAKVAPPPPRSRTGLNPRETRNQSPRLEKRPQPRISAWLAYVLAFIIPEMKT